MFAMSIRKAPLRLAAASAALAAWPATAALAAPKAWQLGLQDAATPVMERIQSFHWLLLGITTVIVLFVLGLLLVCMFRFNAKANPVPSKTSHNTLLEVLWTVLPIAILVVIAIPSFRLLYFSDRAVDADMTIKAIGVQWYWSYEYPDQGNFTFDAVMKEKDELGADEPHLLTTDNAVVVPVGATVRLLVTAQDVIHSWAMPPFGVKLDGVPGRINETWFKVERAGTYYGQCSELCGIRHGFMPITVKAVPRGEFDNWVKKAQEEFAQVDAPRIEVAQRSGHDQQ